MRIDSAKRQRRQGRPSENRPRSVCGGRLVDDAGLLQVLPWAVLVCDARGIIAGANDPAAEVFGCPRDELVGRCVYDTSWWPPVLLDADERSWQPPCSMTDLAARAGGRMEERVLGLASAPGGDVTWLAIGARPVLDADGRIESVVCTLTPTSNGHRSTRQLWARAGRLRALLDGLPDTYFVLDESARIVEWFGGGAPFVPGERGQIIGMCIVDLLAPEHAEPLREAIAEVRAGLMVSSLDIAWEDGEEQRFGEAVFRLLPDGLIAVLMRDVTERWRAEEELLRVEEKYRQLAENAQDVIARLRCSPVVRTEYVSPSVARVLGYSPEAFYADATLPFRLLRRELVPAVKRIMAGQWDFDQPWEGCYRHRDGHEVWLEHRMTPIWGEDGRVALIETVIRDVSERHVQTEQLRESEARFRRLTEEVADVLWRVRSRPSVEMEYMSPAVTRLLGYTPEEFYKDPGLMYRVAVEEQRGALRAVTAGDYDYSRPLEVCFRHREGGRVWLEMSMTAEYDELGRFVAVQGVSRDVTGKHQEAARPRGRGVRARLLEHARDVIWQLQLWPERRFEYVSPSVERLLGHACDEFLADATLFSRLLAPECVALVERFNAGDFDPEELQLLRWIRRDGAEVWTEGRVTPVRDAGGRLVAVRGVARDVTDRILVERDGQSRGWRGLRRRPVRQK